MSEGVGLCQEDVAMFCWGGVTSSCVGARVARRCGVKVERPQRSEDERP
jgi:hypothetical protein